MHRLGLTHNPEGIPKIVRQSTAEFFNGIARKQSTIESSSFSFFSSEYDHHEQQRSQIFYEDEKQETLLTKPTTPSIILPPIGTAISKKSNIIPSASVCTRPQTLCSPIPSSGISLESTSPLAKSPVPLPNAEGKRSFQHAGPVDQDLFRKAYDRAISVARSRLLFRDPYSLTRATATHGVLYSYYDHTPMCIFSRGAACNHNQDKTSRRDQKSKANIHRKKIFDDVVVENYIQ